MNHSLPKEMPAKALAEIRRWIQQNPNNRTYHDLPEHFDESNPLADVPVTTFRARAETDNAAFITGPTRTQVSTFDPAELETVLLIPTELKSEWEAVKVLLAKDAAPTALSLFPALWQVGPYFYYTCRAMNKIPTILSHKNVPVVCEAIEATGIETIVAMPETAADIAGTLPESYLKEKNMQWLLVVPAGTTPEIPDLPGTVMVEHHLFPGFVLGSVPDGSDAQLFIPNEHYYFEIDDKERLVISSLTKEAFPLFRCVVAEGAKVHETADGHAISLTRVCL